jgi:hypothetical protein
MNILTRVIVGVWLALVAVVAVARLGAVEPFDTLSAAFIADGTVTAPVSLVTILTVIFFALAWRVEVAERERDFAAILREKPALAGDKAELARERRIRRKERSILAQEEKALHREGTVERVEERAERKEMKAKQEEQVLERRRQLLKAKREELRDREALGR